MLFERAVFEHLVHEFVRKIPLALGLGARPYVDHGFFQPPHRLERGDHVDQPQPKTVGNAEAQPPGLPQQVEQRLGLDARVQVVIDGRESMVDVPMSGGKGTVSHSMR